MPDRLDPTLDQLSDEQQRQPQGLPPPSPTPDWYTRMVEQQRRWGMPPASQQIPGIVRNTPRTIADVAMAAPPLSLFKDVTEYGLQYPNVEPKEMARKAAAATMSIPSSGGAMEAGLTGLARKASSALRGGTDIGMFQTRPLTAWHASPHEFKQFEYRPLTGEGAIGYGGGVYAAESPGVSGRGGFYDQKFVERKLGRPLNKTERQVLNSLDKGKSDEEIAEDLRAKGYGANLTTQHVTRINSHKSHVYRTIIDAHPEEMLDWDKPLLQQSSFVQNAIRKLNIPLSQNMTGGQVIERLNNRYMRRGILGNEAQEFGRQDLNKVGLMGTKYLDQQSRVSRANIDHIRSELAAMRESEASGPQARAHIRNLENGLRELEFRLANQTQNVVIYDPRIMRIAEKFGIAGILGGTAAAEGTSDAQDTKQ